VQLLLVLLVLSSDGMLGLLLHSLNKVLHVLEGIDLQQDKCTEGGLAWGLTCQAHKSILSKQNTLGHRAGLF
jgi:hypothetical protein